MRLKELHFSTSNISAIVSPIGLKRQSMFIWYLINTLQYNRMGRKNVEILVYLTFKRVVVCSGKKQSLNLSIAHSLGCKPLLVIINGRYIKSSN